MMDRIIDIYAHENISLYLVISMANSYMTDEEYEACFMKFWGIREMIARSLLPYGLAEGKHILDIPSGHGLFALEIAKLLSSGHVHGIGLFNDLKTFQALSRSLHPADVPFFKKIYYYLMDATHLGFSSSSFDFVVNFLGFEDINMTRGKEGVRKAIQECHRVLKPGGIFQLTLCLEGDAPDEKIATDVYTLLGCDAIFYSKEFYVDELIRSGFTVLDEQWVHTCRKMTARQAKEEIYFACTQTPCIFSSYAVHTVPFDTLWKKVKDRIETHGMAYYSHLCVFISSKK